MEHHDSLAWLKGKSRLGFLAGRKHTAGIYNLDIPVDKNSRGEPIDIPYPLNIYMLNYW